MNSDSDNGRRDGGTGRRPRAVFFGSPDLAVPTLEVVAAATELIAVVSQPDRPAGRGRKVAKPAVKSAAEALAPHVPVLQPLKIRTGDLERELRALEPDLFVVMAYGRILPQALLDVPKLGPWNVHASLLPAYRGAAPIQWAIINGEKETGVSIMRMEAGLDTGPVVAMERTAIQDGDTAATLGARLARLGADLLGRVLPDIVRGAIAPTAQDESRASYAPPLEKEHGRLDFSQSADKVSARARGVDPWPGATAHYHDDVVKLFRPQVIGPDGEIGVDPGTIVAITADGLSIACGARSNPAPTATPSTTIVRFAEIQFPGRTRQSATAAAAGRTIAVGERFT